MLNFLRSGWTRIAVMCTLSVVAVQLPVPASAQAESFPSRPIRVIVPFPPGGSTDISTRLLAQDMSRDLGVPVLVENRAGNAGAIGIAAVANAEPDGYTLGISGAGPTILLNLTGQNTAYNPLTDLAFVALQNNVDFVFITRNDSPHKSMGDLLARAKANPNKLSFGNSGISGPSHLTYELLAVRAGIEALAVPYKGESPLLQDVIGGQVDVGIATVPGASSTIKAGRVTALAVAGARRNPIFPDVPTVAEFVPGFESSTWQVIVVPAKTPPAVIARLNAAVNKALGTSAMQEKYLSYGMTATGGTPQEAREFVERETVKWKGVIDRLNARSAGGVRN